MYLERFLSLFFLIFNTVDAAKNCSWSLRTLHVVSSCPMTTEEKLMAEKIKKCEGLAGLQDCSESSLFKYHCVLNEAGDTFLEVCAPEVKILLGHCATFNTSNGRMETQFNRTCNTGERNPCPLQYMSSESFKFPTCYGFHGNLTTYEKGTERSNIDPCLEEKRSVTIVSLLFFVLTVLYMIIIPLVCCRERSHLCIRKCIVCLSWSGYEFCRKSENDANKKGKMSLPGRKGIKMENRVVYIKGGGYKANTDTSVEIIEDYNEDFTMKTVELEDIDTTDYMVGAGISDKTTEYIQIKEKETLFPKRNLHPFPKQMSSLCISNICSINHISHISNGNIWLSNRKHVMEINHNGRILQNFDIDDAPGCASHTIDGDGHLLFFKDDTIFRANSCENITMFLTQTGMVLSIYYSRITNEIILGNCKMYGNKVNSKLLRYNQKGDLIQVIEFHEGKTLYVLPMFITENINGDICTSDSGTLMVKGVNKVGNLHFIYNGKPTQTKFYPTGICNDAFGHILVCNRHHTNPSVHVLDLNGHFLAVILAAKDGISDPYGLCVSDNGCLYLGQYDCNTLMVYRYLDEE